MKPSDLTLLIVFAVVSSTALAEEEFPRLSDVAGTPHLRRFYPRATQAATGERDGSSDAGTEGVLSGEAYAVPAQGITLLAFSASWCAPCQAHVANLTRIQQVLSTRCGRAGDTVSPRVVEVTDSSLLNAFRNPTRRNEATRSAWASPDVGHDIVMVPEAHDDDFTNLLGLDVPAAGSRLAGPPGTMLVVDGRVVSIATGMGGIFADEMSECAGISDADRSKVRDFNAKKSACFVVGATRRADGTNRVGANALSCDFTCPVARPEVACR